MFFGCWHSVRWYFCEVNHEFLHPQVGFFWGNKPSLLFYHIADLMADELHKQRSRQFWLVSQIGTRLMLDSVRVYRLWHVYWVQTVGIIPVLWWVFHCYFLFVLFRFPDWNFFLHFLWSYTCPFLLLDFNKAKLIWFGCVACMGVRRNAYKCVVGTSEGSSAWKT
jgi:hypothetical protein